MKVSRFILGFIFVSFIIFRIDISLADKSSEEASKIYLSQVQGILNDVESIVLHEQEENIYEIYKNEQLTGYAFITSNFAESVGFAATSFNILVCMSPQGVILGSELLSHSEPLFLYEQDVIVSGQEEDVLHNFIYQYQEKEIKGLSINRKDEEDINRIDGVSAATITSILMHQSIKIAANKVARRLSIAGFDNKEVYLDHESYSPITWIELLKDGSIAFARFNKTDEGNIFRQKDRENNFDNEDSYLENYFSFITKGDKGRIQYKKDYEEKSDDESFLDIYFSYANPVGIGRNIFGKTEYIKNFIRSGRSSKDMGFFISTRGNFSVLAPLRCLETDNHISRKNCEKKGISKNHFDRIYIEQNGKKFFFRTIDRTNFMFTRNIEDSTPRFFNEIALLFIDNPESFDPAKSWNLVVNFYSKFSDTPKEFSNASLKYTPPNRLIIKPNTQEFISNNDWINVWKNQSKNLFILLSFIVFCSLIFLYRNKLVKYRRFYSLLRNTALVFCLVWMGWTVGAQLTIVNILNYIQLFLTENFNYSVIVFDPLITIISIVTLLSFFLVGRGFFCGWLCPFGALQELINVLANTLRIKQLEIKERTHKYLLQIKYIILLVIIFLMFYKLDLALISTEVEPFKTAITLKFDREFKYVFYAGSLLFLSIFVSRFYCRYLCPLGAFLVLGGKFRFLNILKRRRECGNPCHLCEKSCPTQAIQSSGKINMNECFYCFDCQEEYYDDHRCPPLVAKLKEIKTV